MKKSLVISALALTSSVSKRAGRRFSKAARASDDARSASPFTTGPAFISARHCRRRVEPTIDGTAALFLALEKQPMASPAANPTRDSSAVCRADITLRSRRSGCSVLKAISRGPALVTRKPRTLLTPGGVAIPGTSLSGESRDLNWLASVRERLGYTWDRFMVDCAPAVRRMGRPMMARLHCLACQWCQLPARASATRVAAGWPVVASSGLSRASGWLATGRRGLNIFHYDFRGTSGGASFPWRRPPVLYTFGDPTR